MKRKLLAVLLCLCMAAILPPQAAFAVEGGAIRLGTGGISKGNKVYLGHYGEENLQWIALDDDGFLLSQYTFGSVRFRDCRYYNKSSGPQNPGYYGEDWDNNVEDSQLKLTMEGLYNGEGTALFDASERGAVAATVLTAESMDYDGEVRPLTAYLYPLSVMEIYDYSAGKYVIDEALLVTGDITNKLNGNEYGWWTRTNESSTGVVRVGGRDDASPFQDDIQDSLAIRGVRPAFHIDSDTVIFVSSAAGGKAATGMENGLAEVGTASITEWKLTISDESHSNFSAAATGANGGTLTIAYSGAATGTNEYISAIVKDSGGNIKYYGRVEQPAAAAGTVDIDLSGLTMAEEDTLLVFSEQYNGGENDDTKLADYASELVEIPLTKNAYAITNSLTGILSNNMKNHRLTTDTEPYRATLAAAEGGKLPERITVKIGGKTLKAGAATYEYDGVSGALTIYAESITGDIEIMDEEIIPVYPSAPVHQIGAPAAVLNEENPNTGAEIFGILPFTFFLYN